MLKLTRLQRVALSRVYARMLRADTPPPPGFTYRAFRRTVLPGPGCVMVPYAGMWLGVEPDGHTHS